MSSKTEQLLPSDVFAKYVTQARETKRWTQADLSAALRKIGSPMHRSVIAKVESGLRKVSLDEFVAFCAALGVSPVHMVVAWDDEWMVRVSPKLHEPAGIVRDWFVGKRVLRDTDDTRFFHYMQAPPQAVIDRAMGRRKERKS